MRAWRLGDVTITNKQDEQKICFTKEGKELRSSLKALDELLNLIEATRSVMMYGHATSVYLNAVDNTCQGWSVRGFRNEGFGSYMDVTAEMHGGGAITLTNNEAAELYASQDHWKLIVGLKATSVHE